MILSDLVTGSIDAMGKTDLYTFSGTASGQVILSISEANGFSGSTLPNMTLYDPDGNVVTGRSYNANTQATFTLPSDGTYVIRVLANDYVSTGSYTLGLEPVP